MRHLLIGLLFIINSVAQAEVLFEGYYKITQFKKHIGFLVQRNEVDPKAKQYKTTSYLKLSKNGFDMTESLQTVSDAELAPVSYTYLATDGKKSKTIDATFKAGKMTAIVTENGEKSKIEKKFEKGTFLSSTLYYRMLSTSGLKTDSEFKFKAFAEEVADILDGTTRIDKKMVTKDALQLLKATNSFGTTYDNQITSKGEVISAFTPSTTIETVLVKDSAEATEGVKVSASTLEKIFGDIPKGNVNVYNTK